MTFFVPLPPSSNREKTGVELLLWNFCGPVDFNAVYDRRICLLTGFCLNPLGTHVNVHACCRRQVTLNKTVLYGERQSVGNFIAHNLNVRLA